MSSDHAQLAQDFSDSITTLPLEEALELRSTLQQAIKWTNDAVDIVTGFCSSYGRIVLVFSPIGDPVLILEAVRDIPTF